MRLPEDSHVARIRTVYAGYDSQADEQRKRDLQNPGNNAILREREELEHEVLLRAWNQGLEHVHCLDVGCGRGDFLGRLRAQGAQDDNLHGVDLLQDRVEAAQRFLPGIDIQCADARRLPFPDGAFELVVCNTVFSSIVEPDVARQVAAEIRRVLAPGGAILWYDVRMPNPGNANTIEMTRRRIRRLFPDLRQDLLATTLSPPLARRLGPLTGRLYSPLAAIPCLRSHYLGLLRDA